MSRMRADPVGCCIYCGATDIELSDEHVVPFSLGGKAIVPDASCPKCSDITSQNELAISRKLLGPFRVRADLPTRRPNKRPAKLTLDLFDKMGGNRSVEIDAAKHPAALILPDLPEPLILETNFSGERRPFRLYVALPDDPLLFNLAKEHCAEAAGIGSFEIGAYYRLLAKIAHSGAYSYPGDWTLFWEPLLPSLILGSDQDFEQCVGGTSKNVFTNLGGFPVVYASIPVGEVTYLVAYFQLFGHQNASPTYEVVVARRKPLRASLNQLKDLKPDSLSMLAIDPEKLKVFLRNYSNGVSRA